jgi:hypothetical protein
MKTINIKKLRNELNSISGSDAKKTIIINNAELYNNLIKEYKTEENQNTNIYIIYQINGMIVKQINELEKIKDKSLKRGGDDEHDTFYANLNKMIN